MSTKSSLTQLSKLDLLDDDSMRILLHQSITTVEELIGALESDPESIGELLGIDERELERLKNRAYGALGPSTREAIEEQRGKRYSLGAVYPGTKRREAPT